MVSWLVLALTLFGSLCEDPGVAPGLAVLTPEPLFAHVQYLAGPELEGRGVGQPGNEKAVAYIADVFEKSGLEPIDGETGYRQVFEKTAFDGKKFSMANVAGILEGRDKDLAREVLLVGAHFDHIGRIGEAVYPGADDNASGTAVLLGVASALAKYGPRPKRTICFVAFNGEEGNFNDPSRPQFWSLAGSTAFAQRKPLGDRPIVGMINMDMVGRYLFEDVLALPSVAVVHSTPNPFGEAVAQAKASCRLGVFQAPLGYLTWTNDAYRSDHAPFAQQGIPILWLSTSMHVDYHRPTDRLEKVRPEQLARIARFVYLTLVAAADAPAETFAHR
ncbi:MAG: M28 family peptidase [Planctomycetota bacterium]